MCLRTIALNLKWEKKEKNYVGYGYKKLKKEFLVRRGYCKNQWRKATGSINRSDIEMSLECSLENSSDYKRYHPGYHIFLNYEDAKKYGGRYNEGRIYKVKFKGVISFGTNKAGFKLKAPCVVTTHVKLLEEIDV